MAADKIIRGSPVAPLRDVLTLPHFTATIASEPATGGGNEGITVVFMVGDANVPMVPVIILAVVRLRLLIGPDRMRAMLDLSGSPLLVYMLSYLVMGITGITMITLLKLWTWGWVWVATGAMLFVFLWMYRISRPYAKLRKLVGLPYMEGRVDHPAKPPASDEVIVEHVRTLGVTQFVVVGYLARVALDVFLCAQGPARPVGSDLITRRSREVLALWICS